MATIQRNRRLVYKRNQFNYDTHNHAFGPLLHAMKSLTEFRDSYYDVNEIYECLPDATINKAIATISEQSLKKVWEHEDDNHWSKYID